MTPEQRLQAARAFWHDEQAAEDHVQAGAPHLAAEEIPAEDGRLVDEDRKAPTSRASRRCRRSGGAARSSVYHLAEGSGR